MHSNDQRPEETALKQYDSTFFDIYSDLSGYLLDSVQTSVIQVLEISESFLNKEASQAINDFHALYEADSLLDSHKNTIDQSVDDIINYVQNASEVDSDLEEKMLDQLDALHVSAERLSFSALQKNIEALVTLETDVKEKVVPILHGVQFEDKISQSITSIKKSLEIILELVHSGNSFNPRAAAKLMYAQLACEKDRALFYKHILETDYHGESVVHLEHLQNLPEESFNSSEITNFLAKLEHYTAACLQWNNEESEQSVGLIIDVISIVQERAQQVFEPSQANIETIDQLSHISKEMQESEGKKETLRLICSTLQNRMEVDNEIKELIQPIVTSIQFHDRICQNMENLSHTLETWLLTRAQVIESSVLTEELKHNFGATLLDQMTMDEEREIIRKHIPGLPESNQEDDGDDIDLF